MSGKDHMVSGFREAVVFSATRWHVFKTIGKDALAAEWLDTLGRATEGYLWRDDSEAKKLTALHSAEREVLEACVEEDRLWVEYEAGWNSVGKYDSARDARIAAVRRYRALLDGKEAT